MQISGKNIFATALIMLMFSSVIIGLQGPLVNAAATYPPQQSGSIDLPSGVTPDMTVQPTLGLSFRPNPVGLGQTILVNMWMEPPVSVTRFITKYLVTFQKPDGTTDTKTVASYQGDSTAWLEYVVDQLGVWRIKFDLPGAYFPAGNYTVGTGSSQTGYSEVFTKSFYYAPATTGWQNLTVQSDPILSWPPAALPTSDYWTRPVMYENREWATIAGDFPWRGPASGFTTGTQHYPPLPYFPANTNPYWNTAYQLTPYVQGPNTAHIAWERVGAISGLIGSDYGIQATTGAGGGPNIVYQGRAYQSVSGVSQTGTGSQNYWQCYDIRTGSIYWQRPIYTGESAPAQIEYYQGSPSVPGETDTAWTVSLVAINTGSSSAGGTLVKYSPLTGAVTTNVSIPYFLSSTYIMNCYVLSIQQVNTTGGVDKTDPYMAGQYCLINWTTGGSSTNFASRIMSNITWPRADLSGTGGGQGTAYDLQTSMTFIIREANFFDLANMGYPYVDVANTNTNFTVSYPATSDNASGIRLGTRIMAINLVTGKIAWDKTLYDNNDPKSVTMYSGVDDVADHGKLAVLMRDGTFDIFDQATGNMLFKTSPPMGYPWDSFGFGAYAIASGYGLLYRFGYGGIYAFDWNTGKTVWEYTAPARAGYESAYSDANGTSVYSWNGGGILADGKLYIYNTEHTPTPPITRGWSVHCINATTGQGIWNITTPGGISAVADGYISVSATDGIQYVFGKGLSKTTVTAPETSVPTGSGVLIQGTVLDQSPAQPGTPCVSAGSMRTWMEYLHKAQPIDGIWHNETVTGVPVKILALDPNGNVEDLGTVTSDMSGKYQLSFTPPVSGTYKITATFAGDGSYGSSWDETGLIVSAASASSPTPITNINMGDFTAPVATYIALGVVAIIIAIAIVGLLLLRKRA